MPASKIQPTGTPTPAPIATPCEEELLSEGDGVGVGATEAIVEEELVGEEVEDDDEEVEVWVVGICARIVAVGFIAKILEGSLQQAKEPIPLLPSSQQYWLVSVIEPPQNRIPAVELFANVRHWSKHAGSFQVLSVQPTRR